MAIAASSRRAKRTLLSSLLLLGVLAGCAGTGRELVTEEDPASSRQFRVLMEELASAWNEGDARRAAACFTADAVYSEPPAKQLYRGREALFEFFGGDKGRPGQMSMQWHHLAFNPETRVGFGEFSFTYGSTAHGVAVVRLRDGKIANWREYWYESDLPWPDFVRENSF